MSSFKINKKKYRFTLLKTYLQIKMTVQFKWKFIALNNPLLSFALPGE